MTTVQDLQKQFHCCMPLFIALGDKVRLSIVELLTEESHKVPSTSKIIPFFILYSPLLLSFPAAS